VDPAATNSFDDEPASMSLTEALRRRGVALGVDLCDADQLIDAAAVGLTIMLWRNTLLEDLHAGDGSTPRWDTTLADLEALEVAADPDEGDRLIAVVAGAGVGEGIPDDVMLRANCSTVDDVRAALTATFDPSWVSPSAPIPAAPGDVPAFLVAALTALVDPDRTVRVGCAEVATAELFGSWWQTHADEVQGECAVPLLRCADSAGVRAALWATAVSGASYGAGWFPNRPWIDAVDRLELLADHDESTALHALDGPHRGAWRTGGFFEALRSEPWRLNGRQAAWVCRSRLRFLMVERRGELAAELGFDGTDAYDGVDLFG
jgi:hypothetical protein